MWKQSYSIRLNHLAGGTREKTQLKIMHGNGEAWCEQFHEGTIFFAALQRRKCAYMLNCGGTRVGLMLNCVMCQRGMGFQQCLIVSACAWEIWLTRSVWLHGNRRSCVREQVESVSCCALLLEGVPLKKNAMDVHLCTQPEGVPSDLVPGAHLQPGKVPIHTSIYSWNKGHFNRTIHW